MSLNRCGWCGTPSLLTVGLCNLDAATLEGLLHRVDGMHDDLRAAIGRQTRHGEQVGRSTTVPLPISLEASDAHDALSDALHAAVRGLWRGEVPRLVVDDAAALLLAHWERVRESWVAPVLLGDLRPALGRAVASVDTPRTRLTVSVPCPACSGGPLRPAGGLLECVACGERSTVGRVRAAV